MKPDLRADDDDVLRSLLGSRPPVSSCPDEGLLAAWAEDRLEDERRDPVEAHLALCDECRATALAQREAARASAAPPAAGRGPALILPFRRRLLPLLTAVAAVVLVGVGVAWFTRPEPDVAERLTQAAEAGARARPDLLAGFRPLSADELGAEVGSVLRGGVTLLEPGERPLAAPARVRWKPVPGATTYRVTLLDADGSSLWTRETTSPALDWPSEGFAPAAGTKGVLEVVADTPLAQVEGRRAFEVASAEAARTFEAAARLLASEEPALADLLRAHLALRRGHTAEALAAARSQAVRTPGDPLARATLEHARRLAGESE